MDESEDQQFPVMMDFIVCSEAESLEGESSSMSTVSCWSGSQGCLTLLQGDY